jgi:ABC-type uncharacterized transport system involved in gliding motility auxiliary subunit
MNSTKSPTQLDGKYAGILWAATGILLIGMLIARTVYPELLWLTAALGVPLLACLGLLIRENRTALKSRSAAYGLNSAVTVILVIGIVSVLNFLAARYPLKADWTKNKLHTLSDQTVKVVKGLQKPVKAVLYAKMGEREKFRPLMDNYKALNTKFEVEYVDPDREPTRAKQANIRKYGTLQLLVGQGETLRESKVDDLTEEKLTNAMIKLLKEKSPTLCAVSGHGEKSFTATDAEGYQSVGKALADQAYVVKDVSLMQEGKVPENCDAIAIIGPTKAFFEAEVKTLKAYLENGGRALIALDMNVKGGEYAPELTPLLEAWNIKPSWAIVVDPLSKMLGVDAAVPIVATYSKDHAITKDFQANSFFPFARPLDVIPGAPQGMSVQWLGQTTPKSWAVTDSKQLASGQIRLTEGQDRKGPLNVAIAVDGKQKDSKAPRNTRLVVFGSSLFATNNYSRFGGNLDFFLNATSWVMEDESLISIRTKEESAGKLELSQKAGSLIFWISVIILPFLIAAGGIVNWIIRRKL